MYLLFISQFLHIALSTSIVFSARELTARRSFADRFFLCLTAKEHYKQVIRTIYTKLCMIIYILVNNYIGMGDISDVLFFASCVIDMYMYICLAHTSCRRLFSRYNDIYTPIANYCVLAQSVIGVILHNVVIYLKIGEMLRTPRSC